MIVQPDRKDRNETELFYENEARRIAMLNEIFGNVELSEAEMQTLIWLVKRAENTVANVVSAIRKAMTSDASGGNYSPVHRTGKVYAPLRSVQSRRPSKVLFALLSTKVTKLMRRIRR